MIEDIIDIATEEKVDTLIEKKNYSINTKIQKIIKLEDVSTKSIWKKFYLKSIDLEVFKGEKILLLGENGSGKTTFFNLLSGRETIVERDYVFKLLGYNYNDKYSWLEINKRMMFLSRLQINWNCTLEQNLLFACNGNEKEIEKFDNYLNIEKYKYFKWNQLSDGYKSRYLIAYALLSKPELLILDEPFGTLDNKSLLESLKVINSEENSNITIFFSSHNYSILETVVDKFLIFKEGALVKICTKNDLEKNSTRYLEVKLKEDKLFKKLAQNLEKLFIINDFIPIFNTYHIETNKKDEFIKCLLDNKIEIISIIDVTNSIRREYRNIVE